MDTHFRLTTNAHSISFVCRKDELLRNYERDLAKLRQAELLVSRKSEQVEELVVGLIIELRSGYLESTYLEVTAVSQQHCSSIPGSPAVLQKCFNSIPGVLL